MATMSACHRFENHITLAQTTHTDHNGIILPFHSSFDRPSPSLFGKFETHFTITFGIVRPVLAHLHEQKEMHLRFSGFGDVLAGRGADGLQHLPALADDDLLVGLAGHENGLFEPRGPVRHFLPLIGLDGDVVGQFIVQALEDLLARDLGGEEASARVFSSSWKICGREFALLQRSRANGGKGDAITDVIAFPEHSRTAPAFSGVQCERDGKPLKAYVIGVLENPATTTSKLLPATHAWRVDERSGKFVKLDVAGLRCSPSPRYVGVSTLSQSSGSRKLTSQLSV